MVQEQMISRMEGAYLYALSRIAGLGNIHLSRVLLKYGSAELVYRLQFDAASDAERRIAALISSKSSDALVEHGIKAVDRTRQLGGHIVSVLDDEYPLSLSQLGTAPPILYVIGELREKDNYAVAVVGTRQASDDGKKAADWLATQLVQNDVTVISGLAKGIDTAAHWGALDQGGRTIAVIGTGLDTVYPSENKTLWNTILDKGGVIVSQYPPDTPVQRWQFPERNKLMSGMAQGTVVVEANEKSGAKLQAQFAAQQGRIVFLMRHQVKSFTWAKNLADRHQAVVVDSVQDVLSSLRTLEDLMTPPQQLTFAWTLV